MKVPIRSPVALVLLVSLLASLGAAELRGEGLYSNSWVRSSATGNVLYRHDEHGLRLTDFSGCGYNGGAVELPDVARLIELNRWISVSPANGDGDDRQRIQDALNAVGQLPTNSHGFRGVVSLAPGDYLVGQTLYVSNSGVVLKGVGDSQASGSRVWATNLTRHTLLEVVGPEYSRQLSEHKNFFAQPTVPAGTRTFRLFDTTDLAETNAVVITRPFTANWISEIDMDRLHSVTCPLFGPCVTNGLDEDWKTDRQLLFERQITRIDGPWVTVDTPLPHTFELRYGGGFVQRVIADTRLENIGIENVFFGSYYRPTNILGYPSTADEDHAWRAIRVSHAKNVWVRKVTGRHFGFSTVDLADGSSHVTVAECRSIDPISKISGDRRYAFHMDKGDHHLIRDCYSDEGRHDFAFGSFVPGPNANVRCRAENVHADSGPHQRWSVGGLYDLIDLDGTWGAEFLGKVGINVQNRGRNSSGHGWTGAYMTVWNCHADTFRVRNPPTARNWLIGSIGWVLDSQWWLPPVGDDPEGTYELAGPYYPPSWNPALPLGRHVHPYSLYFAQLQQRLKWPQSEFREYWVGDMDDFGRVDSPDDAAPIDADFLEKIRATADDLPVTRFLDRTAPTQQIAFTFSIPLAGAERVVAASLVLCLKATGPAAPDDALYLDTTTAPTPLRVGGFGWDIRPDRVTVETLEIDPALLADGRLNVSLKKNIALDWAVLHAQVTPLATFTYTLAPTDDTYARGGSYKEVIHGFDPDFRVKNEDDGDNSRRGYLMWRLGRVSANAVGATVRLFCTGNGQAGNVYHVALTDHEDWSEEFLNWENQPGALPPIAYVVPDAGRWVEFSVLPQVREALLTDRRLGLQLWAPYDLGDAGFAVFASKEDPDTNRHPQLVLQFSNAAPAMTSLTNMIISANTVLGPLSVTVSDVETPAGDLLLTARSSNPALIPDQNIEINSLGSGRFLRFTPLPNRTGVTEITLQLRDDAQAVAQKFLVRVGPATNAPVISPIADQVLTEDISSPRIPFTLTDAYGRAPDLAVTVSVSSFFRIPPLSVTLGSLDPPITGPSNVSERFMVLTPASNYSGSNMVTVHVTDGFQSVTQAFRVTVTRVDDPPGPVSLNEPEPGTTFLPGQPLTLVANIVDSERDLARVEFRHDGALLGTITTPPYRFVWTNPPAGHQRMTAVAVDLAGQQTESPGVFFRIGDEPEAPSFLAIRVEGDVVNVSWDADGRDVQLQMSDQLGAGAPWTDVGDPLTNFDENTVTLSLTNAATQFFRLRELP